MALIRWEPAREVNSLQSEMNRLFNTFFGDSPAGEGANFRRWVPAMDLVETDDHFVLRADLPGMSQDDVSIELEDNILTVSGERTSEQEERREGYHRVERASGRFSRTLSLPEGVDPEAIRASFDRGVLEVRIPKPEERKPRRVAISVEGKQEAIEGKEAQAAGDGQPGEQVGAEAPQT
jgi:HSP20 family protein